jgi:hypothetical protein
MNKKKIKLYLHNDVYHEFDGYRRGHAVARLLKVASNGAFYICYGTGLVVWRAIWVTFAPVKSIQAAAQKFRYKRINIRSAEFKISIATFCLLIIGGSLFMQAGSVISSGLSLQGRVLGNTTGGLDQLKQAQESLQDQQAGLAQLQFAQALKQFEQAQQEIHLVGGALNGVLNLIPQKRDAEAALSAISDVTEAGIALTDTYQFINSATLSAQGLQLGVNNADSLKVFEKNLDTVIAKMDAANTKLQSIDDSSIPGDQRLTFVQARDILQTINKTLHNFKEVNSVFSGIISGNKRVLLFFQNNNELRATGGFLGTYGKLQVQDGAITSMYISSIYDLDGQLTETIIPPSPLLAVNNRWYLRDSNWYFNFPDSARKIISFYEKEGGETPDVVITITPELVTQLLAVTGPIAMPSYGVTLSAENFIETTQVVTSLQYDRTINKPKQMLADFFPLLLQHISTLNLDQRLKSIEALQKALVLKQVMLYATNDELQQKITAFNWGGSIASSDRDYLALVASNLGGTKTDTYLKDALTVRTNISPDGGIINTVTLTRTNPLPNSESTKNTSYIRLYVPNGSELIESSGFSIVNLPDTKSLPGKLDPDVATEEAATVRNLVNGSYISTEASKTVFGNWLVTSGGETKTVTVSYKLPFTLSTLDRYSMIYQKQSGAPAIPIAHTISIPERKAIWFNNETQFTKKSYELLTEQVLSADRFIGVVLEKE